MVAKAKARVQPAAAVNGYLREPVKRAPAETVSLIDEKKPRAKRAEGEKAPRVLSCRRFPASSGDASSGGCAEARGTANPSSSSSSGAGRDRSDLTAPRSARTAGPSHCIRADRRAGCCGSRGRRRRAY